MTRDHIGVPVIGAHPGVAMRGLGGAGVDTMFLYVGTDQGILALERREGEWRPRYLRLQERQVTALTAWGQMLWAGTKTGVWRSTNGGAQWHWVDVGGGERHVRALAVDRDVPDAVYVGLEPAAICYSADGGKSWNEAADVVRLRDEHHWSLPYSPAAGCIRDFAVLGRRVYAAAEVGGMLRSDDAGATWRLMAGEVHADVHGVAAHPHDRDRVYAATGGGRYRSLNGGGSWLMVGDGYTRAIWTDPERPEIVLAGPARYVGAMGRVERSIDGADTWALASDGFQIPMSDMVERFVDAGSHVLAVTSDGELHSAKRGVWMWQSLGLTDAPVRAAAFSEG